MSRLLTVSSYSGPYLLLHLYIQASSENRLNPLSYLSISHRRIIHLGNSDCGWQFWSISQCGYCCPCTNLNENIEVISVNGWVLQPLLCSEVKTHSIPNSVEVMINMHWNMKSTTKIIHQTLTWASEFYFNQISQY